MTRHVTKGPGKRGHIVADTLLPVMFLGLHKLGNICCGHKMFLNKIRNIFCVTDTICVRKKCCPRANGETFVSSFARAFMSRIAVHVRFESLYISLPSSAKKQREMTKFYVFWRTRTAIANFWFLL